MIEYITTNPGDPHLSAPADWKKRASLSLEQQWALAQDLLILGRRVLARHVGQNQRPASLAQVERILHLATSLARLTTDLAQQAAQSEDECPKCCAARLEWEAALNKVYGKDSTPAAPASPSPAEHALPVAEPAASQL